MPSLLRSILSILIGKISGMVIGLLYTPILVRIISQKQYGLYASILAGFSLITLISKGGLFDACRKTVAETNSENGEIQKVISVSMTLSLFYGILGTSIVLILLASGLLPNLYKPYVLILSFSIIFGNILVIVRGSFFGTQKEFLAEILNVSRQVIYVTTALALAYLGYDLFGVFIGYVFSFVFAAVVGIIIVSLKFPSFSLPSTEDFSVQGKDIATYGGYQLVGGMSAVLLYKADILLVEFFHGSTSTALYNSAIVPAEMIWFVPSVIQLSFLQHVADLWSEDNIEKINQNLKNGFKYGFLSLSLFGVGLFGLAEPFLSVYFGAEYIDATTTLRVLIMGTFFFGLSRTILPVFQAIGWIRATEFVTLLSLALNIVLNIILIPQYGIIGAGIGTMISYVTIFIGNIIIWQRSSIEIVSPGWIGRLIATEGVFMIIFIGLIRTSEFSPLIELIIFPPFGLLIFFGINIFAGYLSISVIKSIVIG